MGINTTDFDKDLNPLLEIAENIDLDPLVKIINDTVTNTLSVNDVYTKHHPNHQKYADLIATHIRLFGGNTFANLYRSISTPDGEIGTGPKYHEIVCDVAKSIKVNFNDKQPIEQIERAIFDKILTDTLEKMSETEKEELLGELDIKPGKLGGTSSAAIVHIFRAGGFKSYVIMLKIVNNLWKFLFKEGLSLAANRTLVKFLKFINGPIGIAVTSAWTLFDIASPAKRITIPAVVYIAMLRVKYNTPVCKNCKTMLAPGAKFCGECGDSIA